MCRRHKRYETEYAHAGILVQGLPSGSHHYLRTENHHKCPTFIATTDYHVLAASRNYSSTYVNKFWDTMVEKRELPPDMVYEMRLSTGINLLKQQTDKTVYQETRAYPYQYGIFRMYSSAEGSVIGALIISNQFPITAFEKDSDLLRPSIEKSLKSFFQTDFIVQKEKQLVILSYGTGSSVFSEESQPPSMVSFPLYFFPMPFRSFID